MRQAVLLRVEQTDEGTFGVLAFGAEHCRSLELPWRGNRRSISCIQPGRYRATHEVHRRFGRVYRLHSVPGRAGILLHSANFAGDTSKGWQTHLEGCIAPCERVASMRNKHGNMQRAGLMSRPALNRLLDWADEKPFEFLVKDW